MIQRRPKKFPGHSLDVYRVIMKYTVLIHSSHKVNINSLDDAFQHMLCDTMQKSIPVAIRCPDNYIFGLNPSTRDHFLYQIKENTTL